MYHGWRKIAANERKNVRKTDVSLSDSTGML